MTAFEKTQGELLANPGAWLVTGAAGFIGSHLVELLLQLNQRVVGLDNLATGKKRNLEEVSRAVQSGQWERFTFLEGDILDLATCQKAVRGADYVLHQAALGSVPRSIENPIRTNETNVTGFLNIAIAARDQHVKRLVFASSSSVYGDDPHVPNRESNAGHPLSPYAVSKLVNELYADVFARNYGLQSIGLRYFNIFGPRQNPDGPYAAVIPNWVTAMLRSQQVQINGDGTTSRDFCYVANAVQANLLAATCPNPDAANRIFNIANGDRTTLLELFDMMQQRIGVIHPAARNVRPVHSPFRSGDFLHRQADISLAQQLLGYAPTHTVAQGLDAALAWYASHLS